VNDWNTFAGHPLNQPTAISWWYFFHLSKARAKFQDRRITAQIDQTTSDIDKSPDRLAVSRFFKQTQMGFNHGAKSGWRKKR
jgi:hypothetical protein